MSSDGLCTSLEFPIQDLSDEVPACIHRAFPGASYSEELNTDVPQSLLPSENTVKETVCDMRITPQENDQLLNVEKCLAGLTASEEEATSRTNIDAQFDGEDTVPLDCAQNDQHIYYRCGELGVRGQNQKVHSIEDPVHLDARLSVDNSDYLDSMIFIDK